MPLKYWEVKRYIKRYYYNMVYRFMNYNINIYIYTYIFLQLNVFELLFKTWGEILEDGICPLHLRIQPLRCTKPHLTMGWKVEAQGWDNFQIQLLKQFNVRTLLHFAFTCFDTSNTSFKLLGESRRAKQKNLFSWIFCPHTLTLGKSEKAKSRWKPPGSEVSVASNPKDPTAAFSSTPSCQCLQSLSSSRSVHVAIRCPWLLRSFSMVW